MTMLPHDRHQRTSFSDAYLERLCPFPKLTRSYEDAQRLQHFDLPGLDDHVLASEGRRAQRRADYDPNPNQRAWFLERVGAVEEEKRRRQEEIFSELRTVRGAR